MRLVNIVFFFTALHCLLLIGVNALVVVELPSKFLSCSAGFDHFLFIIISSVYLFELL